MFSSFWVPSIAFIRGEHTFYSSSATYAHAGKSLMYLMHRGSKSQLEWKLKQWHFTKNMGVMDWKYVGNEIHRRKCRGKESKVYLSGIPLRMKNIERGVSRYCYETAIEKAMHRKYTHTQSQSPIKLTRKDVPEPPMPEDQPLLVCTPAPQEMKWPCGLDNVPWLVSRRLVEGNSSKYPAYLVVNGIKRYPYRSRSQTVKSHEHLLQFL